MKNAKTTTVRSATTAKVALWHRRDSPVHFEIGNLIIRVYTSHFLIITDLEIPEDSSAGQVVQVQVHGLL